MAMADAASVASSSGSATRCSGESSVCGAALALAPPERAAWIRGRLDGRSRPAPQRPLCLNETVRPGEFSHLGDARSVSPRYALLRGRVEIKVSYYTTHMRHGQMDSARGAAGLSSVLL